MKNRLLILIPNDGKMLGTLNNQMAIQSYVKRTIISLLERLKKQLFIQIAVAQYHSASSNDLNIAFECEYTTNLNKVGGAVMGLKFPGDGEKSIGDLISTSFDSLMRRLKVNGQLSEQTCIVLYSVDSSIKFKISKQSPGAVSSDSYNLHYVAIQSGSQKLKRLLPPNAASCQYIQDDFIPPHTELLTLPLQREFILPKVNIECGSLTLHTCINYSVQSSNNAKIFQYDHLKVIGFIQDNIDIVQPLELSHLFITAVQSPVTSTIAGDEQDQNDVAFNLLIQACSLQQKLVVVTPSAKKNVRLQLKAVAVQNVNCFIIMKML
ncbi:hypothetical protein MIR68_003829 [Amoeboaphelidium protococcarum]|nr:hypothetical protein MIR68_003829 [Amoeboaphelidium protococcarum]